MKDVSAIAVLIAGVVGLMTAWIGYKAKKREAKIRAEQRASVLSIDDPSVRATYANVHSLKWWLVGTYSAFMMIVGFTGTILTRDILFLIGTFLPVVIVVGLNLLMFHFLRTEPPSRTMKTASIVLMSDAKGALQLALDAVEGVGANVAKLDSEHGIIEGRIPMSFLKGASLIKVKITQRDQGQSEILLTSDATLPTVLFDFGMNARNVRRLKGLIIGAGADA